MSSQIQTVLQKVKNKQKAVCEIDNDFKPKRGLLDSLKLECKFTFIC